MPVRLVALPLSADDLSQLAAAGYALIDCAARTPGLLLAQAPDQPAVTSPVSADEAPLVMRPQETDLS